MMYIIIISIGSSQELLYVPYTVKEALVSVLDKILVLSQMYTAEWKSRVGYNSKVLFRVLSESLLFKVIDTPSSVPLNLVRELSISTLYQVMDGFGLPIAVHTNMATSGWVTFTLLSFI